VLLSELENAEAAVGNMSVSVSVVGGTEDAAATGGRRIVTPIGTGNGLDMLGPVRGPEGGVDGLCQVLNGMKRIEPMSSSGVSAIVMNLRAQTRASSCHEEEK